MHSRQVPGSGTMSKGRLGVMFRDGYDDGMNLFNVLPCCSF